MVCACFRKAGRGSFGCRACGASGGVKDDARSTQAVPWTGVASAKPHGSPEKMASAAAERRMRRIHASDHRVTTEHVARGTGLLKCASANSQRLAS